MMEHGGGETAVYGGRRSSSRHRRRQGMPVYAYTYGDSDVISFYIISMAAGFRRHLDNCFATASKTCAIFRLS